MTERLLTVAQVARRFGPGWSRKRTLRALKAVHARMPGGLLVNTSAGTERPRWVVPVGALERAFPHLCGVGPSSVSDVVVQRTIRRHDVKLEDAAVDVAELRALVERLGDKVRQIEGPRNAA